MKPIKSESFESSKSRENQWRQPQATEKLLKAVQEIIADALAIHWSHPTNDRQGVDAFIERKNSRITPVDFKLQSHRPYPDWVFIELGDHERAGWAVKQTACEIFIFVRAHLNQHITEIMAVESRALRQICLTRFDDLNAAGQLVTNASTGFGRKWQTECVAIKPTELMKLMPTGYAKHVVLAGEPIGGHHE
jgi:hypothetical protein